ncbi:hypothetical protein [Fulvivirga lutea]|uniref:Uncharacterized protein n=1 Tax=Fulvivirga lutea TaxID=2810512 RepID=A0A974WHU2_9BACT|nr:hypothetical protein [Fulvivirga lutea]QSE98656.1 hypothetical protein JR347_06140 [Fulvivirga lutea]
MLSDKAAYVLADALKKLASASTTKRCEHKTSGTWQPGKFHKFIQVSNSEGYANAFAILEKDDGQVIYCDPTNIRFL